MSKSYNYNPLKALWCKFFGHTYTAYDFDFDKKTGLTVHIDKCHTCYKEIRKLVNVPPSPWRNS